MNDHRQSPLLFDVKKRVASIWIHLYQSTPECSAYESRSLLGTPFSDLTSSNLYYLASIVCREQAGSPH
jgi:hypothetical protein